MEKKSAQAGLVAASGGVKHGRLTCVVPSAHVGARREQALSNPLVASLGSRHQHRLAGLRVPSAHIGARREQAVSELLVAGLGCEHERRPTVFLGLVDGRTNFEHLLEQDEREQLVAIVGSPHQGGPALVVLSIHDGTALE